ncbi:glycoside hydrolase family 3 protein [Scatolibacter rhodanostii]|uniref:glycoside hydrolase family 3 protein n=1 Tax=Scatolibacter rhodanostii TaxID=2014781 RepID=UPI000C0792FB|nr:glycoside hydrolase family 3 protein [Scatolibacter rhodanostii]
MGRLLNKCVRYFTTLLDKNGVAQKLNNDNAGGELRYKAIVPLARQAAAESIVLLKNNDTLPLNATDNVAVFGRCAINSFYVGYGSGGDIRWPYTVSLLDGLLNNGIAVNQSLLDTYTTWTKKSRNEPNEGFWGHWPMHFSEMPIAPELAIQAAKVSDIALVVIGRAAGEDRENTLTKGSYYLTDAERNMLDTVTAAFDRVVVIMNCGNIIDMSWAKDYGDKIGAILYAWLGGMEYGNAVADVLSGRTNPCGKLPDTIADRYEDYPSARDFGGKTFNNYTEDIYVGYRYFESFAPEKVLYPFGHGLSYTTFAFHSTCTVEGRQVTVNVTVTNTGSLPGKEIAQIYVSAPQGTLGKPSKVLAAFGKTKALAPGKSETLCLSFSLDSVASYDDSGLTGHRSAYVLEAGQYIISVGNSSRHTKAVISHQINELVIVRQCTEVLAVKPESIFKRLVNRNNRPVYENVSVATKNLKADILASLPPTIAFTGDKGYHISDVMNGHCTAEEFIAQLTPEELDDLCHGEGLMNSKLGPDGNAGALGGITKSLRAKGFPPIITVDGPAGIRLQSTVALLPCGVALAASFDPELVTEIYHAVGKEMNLLNAHMLLAPGMNIHRNPLCGRNFEYFTEDPLLCGKMGAAVVLGLQQAGASAAPKHFACNNQETNRTNHDSRISERALREIYLKGFEIMIQDSNPHALMVSYNKVNGVWSYYNYELATTILRKEWSYTGVVITDWWIRQAASPEFPNLENDAYRIRAGVDVLMPGGDGRGKSGKIGRHLLDTYGLNNGITLGEMQQSAINLLRLSIRHYKTKNS